MKTKNKFLIFLDYEILVIMTKLQKNQIYGTLSPNLSLSTHMSHQLAIGECTYGGNEADIHNQKKKKYNG